MLDILFYNLRTIERIDDGVVWLFKFDDVYVVFYLNREELLIYGNKNIRLKRRKEQLISFSYILVN